MTSPYRRSASAALATVRPIAARLNAGRDPEDLAADVIEVWSAVETSLRALLGGSSLAGSQLVREARGRDELPLDVTHGLLSFAALRDRLVQNAGAVSEAELRTLTEAYFGLDSHLIAAENPMGSPAPERATSGVPEAAAAVVSEPAYQVPPPRRGFPVWAAALVALLLVAAGAFALMSRNGGSRHLEEGIQLYSAGQRPAARMAFERAAREDPKDAMPHIYLGRMAREAGDAATAQRELDAAIRLDPTSSVAMRELGSLLFLTGDYELARRFYVRAVERNQDDKLAIGFLACALSRLGRADEAARMLQHAGPGEWSACMTPRATG